MLGSGGIYIGLEEVKVEGVGPIPDWRKTETVCFSETMASTDIYKSTRRQNPEEKHHHPHRRENLKSHINVTSLH
jgi:hypothetical protein